MFNLTNPQLHRMPDPNPGTPPASAAPTTTPPSTTPPLNSQVNPIVFEEETITVPPPTTAPVKPPAGQTDLEVKGNMHISRIAAMNGYGTYITLWNENAALKAKRKNSHILFHGDKRVPKGDVVKIVPKPDKTEPAQTEQNNPFKVDTAQLFLRLKILDENLQPVGNFPYELNIGGKVMKGKIGNGFGTIQDGLIQEEIPKTANLGTLTITLPGAPPPATPPAPGTQAGPGTPPSGSASTFAPVSPSITPISPSTPNTPTTPTTTTPTPVPAPKPDQIKFTLHIGRLDPIQEQAPDTNCFAGVQARLNNLAFDCGKVDGIGGTATKNAIQRFQRRMSILPEDGLPSPAVQQALFTLHDTAGAGPTAAAITPGVGETAAANDQTIV